MSQDRATGTRKYVPFHLVKNPHTVKRIFLGIILAIAATLAFAPIAEAASYTYANNIATSKLTTRDSGLRSSAIGGKGQTQYFEGDGGAARVYVETYRSSPGYQSIAFASSGGSVTLTHARATSVRQKCYWSYSWGDLPGQLRLTCSVTY